MSLGQQFDAVNVVTALHRVAKVSDGSPLPLLLPLAQRALSLADAPAHLAGIAWSVSKLAVEDQTLWTSISSAARRTLSDFRHQDLACTAWSLAFRL